MSKLGIFIARGLIESGFSIQNRRSLQTLIGKEEMRNLSEAYLKLRKQMFVFFEDKTTDLVGKVGMFNLDIVEGQPVLSYKLRFDGIHSEVVEPKLLNGNISLKNIKNTILEYKSKWIDSRLSAKPLPPAALEMSETMKLLYSNKFKVSQGINEDGYFLTSIIDKKTKDPVQAFVEMEDKCYKMFVKNNKGKYEKVGYYIFDGNKLTGAPTKCEYINTKAGNNRYSGIGLRLHQIAIEKMIQSEGKSIVLDAGPEAFPFHYKCGFRINPKNDNMLSEQDYNKILSRYEEKFGISRSDLEKVIKRRNFNGIEGYGELETKQELAKLVYLQNKFQYGEYCIPMELSPDALKIWSERIKSQPILKSIT